jgi:hypothetical protein
MHDSVVRAFCQYTVKLADKGVGGGVAKDIKFDDSALSRHEKSILRQEARASAMSAITVDDKKNIARLKALRKMNPNDDFWAGFLGELSTYPGAVAGLIVGSVGSAAYAHKIAPTVNLVPYVGTPINAISTGILSFAPPIGGAILTGTYGYNLGKKIDQDKHKKLFTPDLIESEKKYNDAYDAKYFDPEFRERVYESMKVLGGPDVKY